MKKERKDIEFPLWRKKVDASLFNKLDTPIPNWLSKVWNIEEVFGKNRFRKETSKVIVLFNKQSYEAYVLYSKYKEGDSLYKLHIPAKLAEKLKDVFIMSYMRSLEHRLRKDKPEYKTSVEEDIPFWEFVDIEFDKANKLFKLKAHYYQKPVFPELFKQFISSHLLKQIENKLSEKGDFKFVKEDWKPRNDLKKQLEIRNIIYYLLDTQNKLLYIGEAEHIKRVSQARKEIPNWDFFRIDGLPEWLTRTQRLELERLIIRSYASLLPNLKEIQSKNISNYRLINRKIDV